MRRIRGKWYMKVLAVLVNVVTLSMLAYVPAMWKRGGIMMAALMSALPLVVLPLTIQLARLSFGYGKPINVPTRLDASTRLLAIGNGTSMAWGGLFVWGIPGFGLGSVFLVLVGLCCVAIGVEGQPFIVEDGGDDETGQVAER